MVKVTKEDKLAAVWLDRIRQSYDMKKYGADSFASDITHLVDDKQALSKFLTKIYGCKGSLNNKLKDYYTYRCKR